MAPSRTSSLWAPRCRCSGYDRSSVHPGHAPRRGRRPLRRRPRAGHGKLDRHLRQISLTRSRTSIRAMGREPTARSMPSRSASGMTPARDPGDPSRSPLLSGSPHRAIQESSRPGGHSARRRWDQVRIADPDRGLRYGRGHGRPGGPRPARQPNAGARGWVGIGERVRMLGGSFEIEAPRAADLCYLRSARVTPTTARPSLRLLPRACSDRDGPGANSDRPEYTQSSGSVPFKDEPRMPGDRSRISDEHGDWPREGPVPSGDARYRHRTRGHPLRTPPTTVRLLPVLPPNLYSPPPLGRHRRSLGRA